MSIEKPHFDKLVGIKAMNLPPDASKEEVELIISETLQDKGGEFIEGLELEKTEKDKEIIELADQAAENYLRQFGRENVPEITLNNIHLLKEGGTEEYTEGNWKEGSQSSVLNRIIVDRGASDLRLARKLFHELYHQKVYKALQIAKEGEQSKLIPYHTGFSIVSRDGKETYFNDLDEALTSLAEQRFFTETLMNDERFSAEIERMTEEEKENIFTRNDEREKFNALIDKLWGANKEQFSSRDEILKMFFEAQATGRLLKVARLIEETFGKGSFRKLGEGIEIREEFDLTDMRVIERILEGGTEEEREKLRKFHNLSFESLQREIAFAQARRAAIVTSEKDLRERVKNNPLISEEEISMGIWKEQIEPQARDAVLKLWRKGYATRISGFDAFNSQSIGLIEGQFGGVRLPRELMEELESKGVHTRVEPDEISFSCDNFVNLEELKEIWDKIADALPDTGNPAKPIQSSPSLFLLNKGLEWKEKSRRADKITDKLGEKIDEKIKEAVIALSILGLPTSASCEGHADWGISAPWLEIDELSDEFSRTARELLDEFYASRKVGDNIRLQIKKFAGRFRIFNGGEDYRSVPENQTEEQKRELIERIARYQEEMKEFADFLKQKYFFQ